MARTVATRQGRQLHDKEIPMIEVALQPYWAPPKGLNLTNRLSRLSPQEASDIKNMVLDDGSLKSRLGTSAVGTATDDIMAVIAFVTPSQTGHLLRVTTTGIDRWDGTTWTSVASTIFNGGTTDYFSFAGWGNELLMTNGVDKVYSYNPVTGEKGFIADSVPAKHITVFGGRVVLTGVRDGGYKAFRIKWSVKNDNTDWSGDGAGFEDLFAAPGGYIDAAHGVFPVTDDTALIIRDNSIWQMSLTGNVLVPFRFTRVLAQVGTKLPRSITEVPGGFAMVGRDNVLVVGPSSFQTIGTPVRDVILSSFSSYGEPVAKYDFKRNELRIAIGKDVYRYSFRDQGWTKDVYSVFVRDFNTVVYDKLGIPIDDLTGTINALEGTIDDLVISGTADDIFFVFHDGVASSIIGKEDPDATDDVTLSGVFGSTEVDTFAGTDGDDLNGRVDGLFSWIRQYLASGTTEVLEVKTNRMEQTNGVTVAAAYTTGITPIDADYSASVKARMVSDVNAASEFLIGLRIDATTGAGYWARIIASTTSIQVSINKRSTWAGALTSLVSATVTGVTSLVEHTFKFQIVGNALKLFVDDVSKASINDSTYSIIGAIALFVSAGTTFDRRWRFDDFTVSYNTETGNTINLTTGLLQAGSPLQKTKVIECQLEYESDASQTLVFEYSTDKGTTWTQYSTIDIVATDGPQILSVRKTLVGHNLQLRVRSATIGALRVLSFVPRIVAEAMVHP